MRLGTGEGGTRYAPLPLILDSGICQVAASSLQGGSAWQLPFPSCYLFP